MLVLLFTLKIETIRVNGICYKVTTKNELIIRTLIINGRLFIATILFQRGSLDFFLFWGEVGGFYRFFISIKISGSC